MWIRIIGICCVGKDCIDFVGCWNVRVNEVFGGYFEYWISDCFKVFRFGNDVYLLCGIVVGELIFVDNCLMD